MESVLQLWTLFPIAWRYSNHLAACMGLIYHTLWMFSLRTLRKYVTTVLLLTYITEYIQIFLRGMANDTHCSSFSVCAFEQLRRSVHFDILCVLYKKHRWKLRVYTQLRVVRWLLNNELVRIQNGTIVVKFYLLSRNFLWETKRNNKNSQSI
jgi:hypothetical protein